MTIEIVQGTNSKPVASAELVRLLSRQSDLSGQLFIGYPIIGTSEGPHMIDALFISKDKGITILDLIEGSDARGHDIRQDDSANKLEAKLRLQGRLVSRRTLLIPIHTISFAPGINWHSGSNNDNYPIVNAGTLLKELNKLRWPDAEADVYHAAMSALESISTIRQGRARRETKREDSRGTKLKALEASIATLDNMQHRAVIETVEGLQRIRGLAGSGKTIVLALKAAYLHAQHPDWRIAVTFNTRSLKGYFRRLINNLSLEQTNEEPDWERLRIVSAWGAPGNPERDGIYYEFCRVHDVPYLDFRTAREGFRRGKEFAGVCAQALGQARQPHPVYDAILVDEAQDFDPAFLRLCYTLLKEPKRLIYAYDELQNLSQDSLPSPEVIFGDINPRVSFSTFGNSSTDRPREDIILEK